MADYDDPLFNTSLYLYCKSKFLKIYCFLTEVTFKLATQGNNLEKK